MSKEYMCPVCKGEIIHERVDDGITQNLITYDGEVKELINKSDGYDSIYCTIDKNHSIPSDLQEEILDLIY